MKKQKSRMIDYFNDEIDDQISNVIANTLQRMTHEQLNQLYFDVSGENKIKLGFSKIEITELLMNYIQQIRKPIL